MTRSPQCSQESVTPQFTTIQRVAARLHISTRSVRRLIKGGHLHVVSIGRAQRITVASLEAFIARGGTAALSGKNGGAY